MKNFKTILLALTLIFFGIQASFSQTLTNGGFETGDLSGWTIVHGSISVSGDTPSGISTSANVVSSDKSEGTYSLLLGINGSVSSPCGTAHGPSATSSAVTVTTGTLIAVDWKALMGSDNYDVYGYIVEVATGNQTQLFHQSGASQAWTSTALMSPYSGSIKFKFLCGTQDATCGMAVGATMYIDNIRLVPTAPVATAATQRTNTSFYANWDSTNNAIAYFLDIATDSNFTSMISGFNNKNVGKVLTYPVTGLTSGTNYYYRVRVSSSLGTSLSSNKILAGAPPVLPCGSTIAINAPNFSGLASAFQINGSAQINSSNNLQLTAAINNQAGSAFWKSKLNFSTDYSFSSFFNVKISNLSYQGADGVAFVIQNGLATAVTTGGSLGYGSISPSVVVEFDTYLNGWDPNANHIAIVENGSSTTMTNYGTPSFDMKTSSSFNVWIEYNGSTKTLEVRAATSTTRPASVLVSKSIDLVAKFGTTNLYAGFTGSTGGQYSQQEITKFLFSNLYKSTGIDNTCTYVSAPSTVVVTPTPTSISKGNTSTVVVHVTLPDGTAAANTSISFATSTGGTFSPASALTDASGNATFTFTATSVTAGAFQITAIAPGGATGSNTINIITGPIATAATSIKDISFLANWNQYAGTTSYSLDVATDSAFTNVILDSVQVGNVLNYTVTGLTQNTKYYYKVSAIGAFGKSDYSNIIGVYSVLTSISANAATLVKDVSFTANWNTNSLATNYRIDVATDTNFTNILSAYNNLLTGNVNNYSITGLTQNTKYYYRVRAINSNVVSANSNIIREYTTLSPIVAKSASSVKDISFVANWTEFSGVTNYRIDVATDSNFTNILVGYNNLQTGNVNNYAITGLSENTRYFYRIRGENIRGTSLNSNVISVYSVLTTIVATPATNRKDISFTANWNLNSLATNYRIDVATDTNFTNILSSYSNFLTGNVNNYSITGLTQNTKYYYRLRAVNTNGVSVNSNIINVYTVLSTIVAKSATTIKDISFVANWDFNSGATNYSIDVATDSNFTDILPGFSDLPTGNVNNYAITGLKENTKYFFRVRAINSRGGSLNSNVISVYTVLSAIVANPATNKKDVSFTANWNSSTGATNYRIDVATDTNFTSILAGYNNLSTGNINYYSISGLTQNTKYFYRVRAENSHGVSANSNIISTYSALSSVVATQATNRKDISFTANWNLFSGATNYRIDVATDTNFLDILAAYSNLTTGNVNNYAITGLSPNTHYFYRLRAQNSQSTSLNSNIISVYTVLTTITATAATNIKDVSFTANWNASTGATNYRIDVATDTNFTNILGTYYNYQTGNVNNISITGTVQNTKYFYRVRAENSHGNSVSSNIITLYSVLSAIVAKPATAIKDTSFIANWNLSSGATNYRIDVATDANFANILIGYIDIQTTNVSSYQIRGLLQNTQYFYRVRAENARGVSVSSNVVSLYTVLSAIVAKPGTNRTENSFSANWNLSAGATSYRMDVANDTNFTSILIGYNDLLTTNTNNYTVINLAPNTKYYYRLRAENARGVSTNSNIIPVYTVLTSIVARPATTIKDTSFVARWDFSAGATNYRIDVATDNNFANIIGAYSNLSTGNVNNLLIIGLNENTPYYYRVRAENSRGTSLSSNEIPVITVLSAIVANPATNRTDNSFTANWKLSSGATNYRIDVATDTNFVSIISTYRNLITGNTNNFAITNLAPNTKYFYRLRAENIRGVSVNSNVITVYTILSAIIANPATNIKDTSFVARWDYSTGATNYRIDVSTDNNFSNSLPAFSSILPAYNNLSTGNVNSLSINGLAENTQYFYRLRAENSHGVSLNSNIISVYTVLTAIVATPATNRTDISFSANWKQSQGAANYRIDVATDTNFTNILSTYRNLLTGNVGSLSISGLNPNTKYFYRVRAENSHGVSINSNVITVYTVLSTVVATPATSIKDVSFTANWKVSTGASNYSIDVATDNSFANILFSYNDLATGNVITFPITGLAENTQYFYRLRAVNSNGVSASSNIISVYTVLTAIVATPATKIEDNAFIANWNPSLGATNYRIDVARDTNFTTILPSYNNLLTGDVRNYAITGLTENTHYFYRLRAENSHGVSVNSNIISLYTVLSAIVANPATNIKDVAFTANWNLSAGATNYKIDVATDITFANILGSYNNVSTGNVANLIITGLTENTQYFYRLRAVNSHGVSVSSNTISVYTVLSAIVATKATNITDNSFTANWNTSLGATNYRIDVATDNAFANILPSYNNVLTGNGNNFTLTDLTENTQYFYRLRAENSNGVSTNSNIVSVYTALSAIVAIQPTNRKDVSFVANWALSSGATTYRIDVATDHSFNNILVPWNDFQTGNVDNYMITGLEENTVYYYRVRAENSHSVSLNSNIVSARTILSAVIATPATNIKDLSFTANWKISTGATNYRIDVATDINFTDILTSTDDITYENLKTDIDNNFGIKGLLNDTFYYYYRVKAENSDSVSDYSNTIKVLAFAENIKASNYVSPNGDGFNDLWVVKKYEALKDYDLIIFNNIGEKLYQTKAYNNNWDATYKGTALPSGTYYYIFKKESSVFKGFITVVR